MPNIDPEVLDHYRNQRGLTDAQLANACNLEERTIRRVRKDSQGSEDTLKRIAGALGIATDLLRNGIQPPLRPLAEKTRHRYDVNLYCDIPFKAMAPMLDAGLQHEKGILQSVIGGTSEIELRSVREGSTIATLRMTDADILRLLAAMMDHALDMLRITRVELPDHSWLIVIIALLNYANGKLSPQTIDEQTLGDLLSSHALEHELHMKTRECVICKKID